MNGQAEPTAMTASGYYDSLSSHLKIEINPEGTVATFNYAFQCPRQTRKEIPFSITFWVEGSVAAAEGDGTEDTTSLATLSG